MTEYEKLADQFLGTAKPPHVMECKRKRGDILRFDPNNGSYGVLDKNGVIRTYCKPVPCSSVPAAQRQAVKQAGRCHSKVSNLVYFQSECTRW